MSFLDTFNQVSEMSIPQSEASLGSVSSGPCPFVAIGKTDDECYWSWEKGFDKYRHTQTYLNSNTGGFISPFESNWNTPATYMGNIEEIAQFQPVQKVDPNKIFTSDIAALRTLQNDQLKITRLFEAKLKESLTDKGKFGLDESDIEAMQALTAARSAIANMSKEQVNIKKNITDIRIKQRQLDDAAIKATTGGSSDGPQKSGSVYDVGRSILDNIFDTSLPTATTPVAGNFGESVDINTASSMLDNLTSSETMSDYVQFESLQPTTYAVVGASDDEVEFETYDKNGNLLPNYPNPTSKITKVDRQSGNATDEFLVSYPLKVRL